MKPYTDREKIIKLRAFGDACVRSGHKGVFTRQEMRLAKTCLEIMLGRPPTDAEILEYQNR